MQYFTGYLEKLVSFTKAICSHVEIRIPDEVIFFLSLVTSW